MERRIYLDHIKQQFQVHKVCALLGPRQVGKTTLAHQYVADFRPEQVHFFDLENPRDLLKFDNPMLLLSPIMEQAGTIIVIDEIQQRPDLFPVLRVLVDQYPGKLLILGSASRDLIRQSSETLAGRIGYIELPPFSLLEVDNSQKLWLQGGFPLSYLAQSVDASFIWREAYIRTFLERDIPMFGFNVPMQQIYRFWMMLCHYHGQTFNASEIGKSLGITDYNARKYLDILTGTFMVRMLQPWFESISKRQIKSPKVYFRDSGILHALLDIRDWTQLTNNPRLGAFWEGFALEEIIRCYDVMQDECFFWATQSGGELDLLLFKKGKRLGFEFKYSDAPKATKSMHDAVRDLQLDHLYVIFPGNGSFPMTEQITAYGLETFVAQGRSLS